MKITEVSPQKNNSYRVNVFIDGEYALSLDAAEAALKGIKSGKEIDDAALKNLLLDSEYSKSRDAALGVLSRKSITSKALLEYLMQKGYSSFVSNEVINELTDLGYIDDYAYANMYFEYCMEKVWGKKKIEYEMKNKGIPNDVIQNTLLYYNDDMQLEKMKDIILSKYSGSDLHDIKIRSKITRYFVSRGFDFSKTDLAISLAKEISGE